MALVFDVKVIPSSGRKGWKLDKASILKCNLKSPAEQGKANKELIKEIAQSVGVTQDKVAIVAGAQSRTKRIRIECDITYDKLLMLLGINRQISLFV